LKQQIFHDRSGGVKSRLPVIIDAVAEHLPTRVAGDDEFASGGLPWLAALRNFMEKGAVLPFATSIADRFRNLPLSLVYHQGG